MTHLHWQQVACQGPRLAEFKEVLGLRGNENANYLSILELYGDNGKENGTCHIIGLYRDGGLDV